MKRLIKIGCTVLLAVLLQPLQAQKKDVTEEYAKKYPEENAVYLERKEYNTIKLEKGQLKVYTKNYQDMLLLSDKVSSYSDYPLYFSSFSELSSIKASSLVPDGKGTYLTIPVKEKYVTNEFSSGSFYDDYKANHLVYTGLTRGSRTVLDYMEKLNEPRFFGRFFFSTGIPTENAEFTVEVPRGVKIEWKLFNITEKDLEFTTQVLKKKTIYTWRKRNSPKYRSDKDAPSSTYFAAHIIVRIVEYTAKKKVVKLLDGPEGLYSWYYSMVKDVNLQPDPALKRVVDSLTNGVTDEQEKVRRIFYWVQDNIKYVAFEDGMGGFVPREANKICSRRYGDCKDMASITTTMLRMAGIQAYLTWIGTRSIPYKYNEVPSPLSDNHMICTYIIDGNYFFLDATGKNAPMGTPTSMIQGKEALIGKGDGKFEIVQVPVIPAEKNLRSDSVYMSIDANSNVSGNGYMYSTGYDKIHLTYPLDGSTEKDRIAFFKKYLQKGSNKFVIDSLDYAGLYDRDKKLEVNYHYTIGGYAHTNANEIYVNMQLDKSYLNSLIDTADREAPFEIDYQSRETHVSVLEIPAGYSAGCLPADSRYDDGKFAFEIKYRQEGNRIICTKTIWVRTLMVNPSDFNDWNTFVGKLTAAYIENVTLIKSPVASQTPKNKK